MKERDVKSKLIFQGDERGREEKKEKQQAPKSRVQKGREGTDKVNAERREWKRD